MSEPCLQFVRALPVDRPFDLAAVNERIAALSRDELLALTVDHQVRGAAESLFDEKLDELGGDEYAELAPEFGESELIEGIRDVLSIAAGYLAQALGGDGLSHYRFGDTRVFIISGADDSWEELGLDLIGPDTARMDRQDGAFAALRLFVRLGEETGIDPLDGAGFLNGYITGTDDRWGRRGRGELHPFVITC